MNDKNYKFPIGELAQSASSSSPKVDELAEKKKNQKKSLIKMGTMGILTLILLIFSSLSWFTMNTQVETSGMGVKSATLPFDIATKGASIRNTGIMSTSDGKYILNTRNGIYSEGTLGTFENQAGTSGTYYTGDSILLRYDTGASEIGPDDSGELSLYVIPKSDDAMKVKVSLNVVAFAEIEKKDAQGKTVTKEVDGKTVPDTVLVEITDEAAIRTAAANAGNTEVADSASDYVSAANYLKGHIMFFGGRGDTTNETESLRYSYVTPYTTRTISKSITANNEGKAIQVPIYWMWTNTLGQIAFKKNNSLRNGMPVVADMTDAQIAAIPNDPVTDKEKVIQYLKDNKNSVLKDWNDILTGDELLQTLNTNPNPKTISEVVDGLIDNIDNTNNFNRLSECYNAADFLIGTKVAYFMIEVTVEADT